MAQGGAAATSASFDWALTVCRSRTFHDAAQAGIVACMGITARGNPLIVVDPSAIAQLKSDDSAAAWPRYVLYVLQLLDEITRCHYEILLLAHELTMFSAGLRHLRRLRSVLPRRYRKNMVLIHVFRPRITFRATMAAVAPFVSEKLWRKLRYYYDVPQLTAIAPHVPRAFKAFTAAPPRPVPLVIVGEPLSAARQHARAPPPPTPPPPASTPTTSIPPPTPAASATTPTAAADSADAGHAADALSPVSVASPVAAQAGAPHPKWGAVPRCTFSQVPLALQEAAAFVEAVGIDVRDTYRASPALPDLTKLIAEYQSVSPPQELSPLWRIRTVANRYKRRPQGAGAASDDEREALPLADANEGRAEGQHKGGGGGGKQQNTSGHGERAGKASTNERKSSTPVDPVYGIPVTPYDAHLASGLLKAALRFPTVSVIPQSMSGKVIGAVRSALRRLLHLPKDESSHEAGSGTAASSAHPMKDVYVRCIDEALEGKEMKGEDDSSVLAATVVDTVQRIVFEEMEAAPEGHRSILSFVIDHLGYICSLPSTTFKPQALGVVFAVVFFNPGAAMLDMTSEMPILVRICACLIEHRRLRFIGQTS